MALLCANGDLGRGRRRLHYLCLGAQGRQRSNGEETFQKESRKSLPGFRTLGILRRRGSRHSASAVSLRTLLSRGGRDAVSATELSWSVFTRARQSVLHRQQRAL